MIGMPNTNETGPTTNGTATVTYFTQEKTGEILDNQDAGDTLNPGAPGRRDQLEAPVLLSAGRSEAATGALLVATGAEAQERSATGTGNLEMVKEESVMHDENVEDQSDVSSVDAADLPYFDREALDKAMNSRASLRYYLRKMAALWPDATIEQLATNIYNLFEDSGVGASSVLCIFRGRLVNKMTQMSDLRIILRGHGVMRPGRPGTHRRKFRYSVSTQDMQIIGSRLMVGRGDCEIARLVGCDRDLVNSIEKMFRLREAYREALTKAAMDAVTNGVSVRGFAKEHSITKSAAERELRYARSMHKQKESEQCILRQDQNL